MKLLVVEDEARMREAIIENLKLEGYLADGAENGEVGLDMIRSGLYDLVLLDINLPKLNGIDILSIARKLGINTPVILLTALSQLEDKIEGMDSGADDYITKPFEMKELMARIRMVTRRQSGAPTDSCILKVGNLVLDTSSHCARNDESDRSVQLARKEFHLLEYMMRNVDHVLTREQITTRVWGYDSDSEYNNVDVYISYLRKKFAFLKVNVQITSVRCVGYRLQEK